MAHRFACLHPEMLAAAASISGSIPRDRSCAPKIPISYLQVFGDKDTVTPINGKVSSDGWFYEKPEISFNKWAESMGCREEIEASNLLTAESSNLICSSRRSCSKGRSLEVINCLVPDGGHAWPGQKPCGARLLARVHARRARAHRASRQEEFSDVRRGLRWQRRAARQLYAAW